MKAKPAGNFFTHFITLVVGLSVSFAALASVTYVAKKGDKLSKVAGQQIAGPVWGKQGSLIEVLALNPEIKNPDVIYPNQKIILPVESQLVQEQRPSLSRVATLPVAARAPADVLSAPEKPQDVADEPSRALLEISPYYGLVNISANDKITGSQASAASSVDAGVDLRSYQHWSDDFRSFIQLHLGVLSFEQPTDTSKSLQRPSNFMSGIGLGGDFSLSQALHLRVFGEYEKQAVLESISTTSITVSAVSVPEVGAGLSLDILKSGSLTLGASGNFSLLFQSTTTGYTVSQGTLYGGQLYFKQDLGRSALQTELGYFSRQQNTNLTIQTDRDIFLQLKWCLPFGKSSHEGSH